MKILSVYNVKICKNNFRNLVDKKDWSVMIEFVGKETAEQTFWLKCRSEWGSRSNHNIVCKYKTEIESENK